MNLGKMGYSKVCRRMSTLSMRSQLSRNGLGKRDATDICRFKLLCTNICPEISYTRTYATRYTIPQYLHGFSRYNTFSSCYDVPGKATHHVPSVVGVTPTRSGDLNPNTMSRVHTVCWDVGTIVHACYQCAHIRITESTQFVHPNNICSEPASSSNNRIPLDLVGIPMSR